MEAYSESHPLQAVNPGPYQEGQSDNGPDQAQNDPDEYRPKPTAPPLPPEVPRRRFAPLHWIKELLALLVGLAAVLAMYGVLAKYDGSRLPSFPYEVTLNTFVSLLAQVLTVCVGYAMAEAVGQAKWNWFSPRPLSDTVVFDTATRSPLGAAQLLLLQPRIVLGSLAGVGALVVLSLPLVGVFTQQLVRYRLRTVVASNSTINATGAVPSLPRSVFYGDFQNDGEVSYKPVNLPFKGGVYSTIYNIGNPDIGAIDADCFTGNCTWPDFTTIAMCSQCVDASADVVTVACAEYSYCTYVITDGHNNGPTGGWLMNYSQGNGSEASLFNASTYHSSSCASAALDRVASYGNEVARVAYMLSSGGKNITGYVCSLYLCVQTIHASMMAGRLTETVVSTFPNTSTTNTATKITVELSGSAVIGNVSLTPGPDDGPTFFDGATSFNVGPQAFTGMVIFLDQVLQGYVIGGSSEIGPSSDDILAVYSAVTPDYGKNTTSPTLPKAQGGIIGYIYRQLATSITNVMRSDAVSGTSVRYNGTAFLTETYVDVDWPWLALPAIVLALALVCSVAVIWQTARADVDCFKSDSLPALFTDLVAPVRLIADSSRAPLTLDEMMALAEKTKVVLYRTPDGRMLLG